MVYTDKSLAASYLSNLARCGDRAVIATAIAILEEAGEGQIATLYLGRLIESERTDAILRYLNSRRRWMPATIEDGSLNGLGDRIPDDALDAAIAEAQRAHAVTWSALQEIGDRIAATVDA